MEPMLIISIVVFIAIPLAKYILARRAASALAEAASAAKEAPEPEASAPPARTTPPAENTAGEDPAAVWRRLAGVPALLRARPERWTEVQREAAVRHQQRRAAPCPVREMISAAIAEIEDLADRGVVARDWAGRMILRLRFIGRYGGE